MYIMNSRCIQRMIIDTYFYSIFEQLQPLVFQSLFLNDIKTANLTYLVHFS